MTRIRIGSLVLALGLGVLWAQIQTESPTSLEPLIDDFSQLQGWRVYTDRVMGGQSTGKQTFFSEGDVNGLRLTGTVSLANRGGFIQSRRALQSDGKPINASAFAGVGVQIKGNGQIYRILLRTRDCRKPWQYYGTQVRTTGEWQDVNLPFSSFEKSEVDVPLDVTALTHVAVAGMGREFEVDVAIKEIRFYGKQTMWKELTPAEKRVIVDKGTERPFTGEYTEHFVEGTYVCRRCQTPLYQSSSKFQSHCGWPSFDDEIPGAVQRVPDADGRRTEIVCAHCEGHLGHVFLGEGYTDKNTRHCVNSMSMAFVPRVQPEKAYFAGGCFWGVEHLFQQAEGVLEVTSGYMGGHVEKPTYQQVCTKKTGHAEVVEVVFDPSKTHFEKMVKLFFEIHDFTQRDGQGPDLGPQYRSVVFYASDEQKAVTEKVVGLLKAKGYDVATEITKSQTFWPAEDYHQDYYEKTGKVPYCHAYRQIFKD